jgi:hypothetical protein
MGREQPELVRTFQVILQTFHSWEASDLVAATLLPNQKKLMKGDGLLD